MFDIRILNSHLNGPVFIYFVLSFCSLYYLQVLILLRTTNARVNIKMFKRSACKHIGYYFDMINDTVRLSLYRLLYNRRLTL